MQAILQDALSADSGDRESLIAKRCANEPELEAEVRRLLAAADSAGEQFLNPIRFGQTPLPDLELLEEVGSGGMGVVYRARQVSLNRMVAVKCLHPGHLVLPGAIESFRNEARRVSSLRHPGIVAVHTVGESAGTPYFVMDLVDGPSLLEFLRQPLEQDDSQTRFLGGQGHSYHSRVAEVLADVADALQYAHENGVIHRDVKPGNILVDPGGRPLLVDFGIAREIDRKTQTLFPVGTPHYMSPEQARLRLTTVDHRTDVYSLGVVAYELLTRRRPFEGDTEEAIFRAINDVPPIPIRKLRPSVPVDLETVCAKAMDKDLHHRYSSAGAFAADLRRILRHEAPSARRPGMVRHARSFLRRHRRLATIGAVVLLAVGGGWVGSRLKSGADEPTVTLATYERQGMATAHPIDPLLGIDLDVPAIRLGETPIDQESLPVGSYRIEVRDAEGRFAELFFHAPYPEEDHVLPRLRLARTDDVVNGAQADPALTPRDSGMVRIEGGPFRAGATAALRRPGFAPLDVELALAEFYVDRYEVTNGQFREYLLAEREQKPPRYWPADFATNWNPEWSSLPVTGVTEREASAFAAWSGKRLPTFVEWQRLARGPEALAFPWGSEPDDSLANVHRRPRASFSVFGITVSARYRSPEPDEPEARRAWVWQYYLRDVEPAGSRPADRTVEGVEDVAGNVREMTATPNYQRNKGEIDYSLQFHERITGGRAYVFGLASLDKGSMMPALGFGESVGFRCVRSSGTPSVTPNPQKR